ncbi:MAG: MBL fold metallo-hydrolase [Bacteroidaceae bacterium]|nr:MBL fold metallo-hydrolase [Bacteroidaceae bacterium]
MQIKRFIFNPIEVNCYLLWDDTKEALLIDCGALFEGEREELKGFIADNGLVVKHYLNTHLHFDHIFGNAFVEEAFGVKYEANDGDWPWVENIAERVARFGFRYTEYISRPERVLQDGDTITFGNQCVKAIAVPGHSPGSLAYYIPEHKMVFTGDALFRNSIGRTDFPDSDHQTLINCIKERLFTLPDDTVVYPGHSESTTIGYEKDYNMYIR